jgi:hypothetical protein
VIPTAICFVAGLSLVSLSAPAHASECLSSPGASAPGRHWFYWTDKISNQRCWFAKETAEMAGRDRAGSSSSLRNQSSGGYEQALPVAPTEAESPIKSWFSSNFPTWDGWGSRTEAMEAPPDEATLPRKRSGNQRDHVKTSQQSKQRHKSERHVSERAKQQAANRFTRVLPTARDKDVPDATFEKKAVGEKGVLTPGPDVEDWQKALYQEFLVWRTKQMMFGNGD